MLDQHGERCPLSPSSARGILLLSQGIDGLLERERSERKVRVLSKEKVQLLFSGRSVLSRSAVLATWYICSGNWSVLHD
jgi:hypothetical protein